MIRTEGNGEEKEEFKQANKHLQMIQRETGKKKKNSNKQANKHCDIEEGRQEQQAF